MKKNIKTVKIRLTKQGLDKFKRTPTFKNLLHKTQIENLKVGENTLRVNHYIYGRLKIVTTYDKNNMKLICL